MAIWGHESQKSINSPRIKVGGRWYEVVFRHTSIHHFDQTDRCDWCKDGIAALTLRCDVASVCEVTDTGWAPVAPEFANALAAVVEEHLGDRSVCCLNCLVVAKSFQEHEFRCP